MHDFTFKFIDGYEQKFYFEMLIHGNIDPWIEFSIAYGGNYVNSNYIFDFNDIKRLYTWLDKMINCDPIEPGESMINGKYRIKFHDFNNAPLSITFKVVFGIDYNICKYVFGGINIRVGYDTSLVNDHGTICEGHKGSDFVDLGFEYTLTKLKSIELRDYIKNKYNGHLDYINKKNEDKDEQEEED